MTFYGTRDSSLFERVEATFIEAMLTTEKRMEKYQKLGQKI